METTRPPDFIIIPEHLKSIPVASLRGPPLPRGRPYPLPTRLVHLLQYAGIRRLGDLDGKRLSDFETYRGTAKVTIGHLRITILRAIHPGAEPDSATRPILMRYWQPPEPTLEVAPNARRLRVGQLPLSARLEHVLENLGVSRLGQLHGLTYNRLRTLRNFGRGSLAELLTLLQRANAGEFTFTRRQLSRRTPADLPRLIDDLLRLLTERDRAILKLRFGATGRPPQTLAQIGEKVSRSRELVSQRLERAIRSMRGEGGAKLQNLLAWLGRQRAKSRTALTEATLATWQDPARPFRYAPEFYARLIPRLRLPSVRSSQIGLLPGLEKVLKPLPDHDPDKPDDAVLAMLNLRPTSDQRNRT